MMGGSLGNHPWRTRRNWTWGLCLHSLWQPHNGELVEKVAKMAHTLGREVATPAQTREILKMSPRASRREELQVTAN
jgi:hypothetical protein